MGLIDSIIGAESGGNPNAQNPNSSASGPGQFIDGTWLDTIRRARPDIADGKSDSDLIALKSDPQLSRQMTEAYANQNQAILSNAGLPVTPGNTYLAHFAGPQGAVKVLQSDPNASVSDILGPSVVKANPFLQGMTAQGLQAWASQKMGGSAAPQQAAQGTPAAPLNIAPTQAIPPQPAPTFAPPQAQPSAAPQPGLQMEPPQPLPPIFFPPRKPINLAALRAAFSRS